MYPNVNAKENVELEESDYSYKVENKKKTKWHHWLLLNRPLKVVLALILTTIVAPLLIYRYLFFTTFELPPSDGFSFGSCLIPRHIRLPCGYGDVPADKCHRDCCYDHHSGACFHRFPSTFSYILNETWKEEVFLTPRIDTVPFGSQRSLTNIRLSIDEISSSHLSLTFYKSDELIVGRKIEEKKYAYAVGTTDGGTPGELQVIVNSAQGTIFNTARGPFIASKDIWEIAFKITDEIMYGLGEIPLKENTTKVLYNHKGGMSSVPLIYASLNGFYHGLLIDTTAPTEIIIGSENQLIIRSITTFGLKFHLFVGPNPVDIMKDVSELIGADKHLEYWMLGVHVCSETTIDDPLAYLRYMIDASSAISMPFDSHCGIERIVFDTNCDDEHVNLVNNGATTLRSARKKFVPHISPYIQYTELKEKEEESGVEAEENEPVQELSLDSKPVKTYECFDNEEFRQYIILDPESEDMYFGTIDEHIVIYPKYDNISEEFMKQLWVYDEFDGIILENNWPLDETDNKINKTHLYLPYFSDNFKEAFNHTPQWNATRPDRYLEKHNLYGNEFALAFQKIKPDVPIVSTSQWMNGNIVVNRQGVETSWSSLQRELVAASLGGISGHWYWSSPICGDTENFDNITHARLCVKWYMAATYFPIINISSKEIKRYPLGFVGSDRTRMIEAIKKRMRILPYLYTVLQEGPILRPMFYQFPSIKELANLTTQFSVGDALLIVPNLQPRQSHVHFWMPPGQWYEFWGGLKIKGETGRPKTMTTTEADFVTLARGGYIIIMHEQTGLTAEETRFIGALNVIIALHCETRNVTVEDVTETAIEENQKRAVTPNDETTTYSTTTTVTTCFANGKLYVNPNMTLVFEADAKTLKITVDGDDFDSFCDNTQAVITKLIWRISIYGLDEDKNNVDNHRELKTYIDMCVLKTDDVITHELV